MSTSALALIVDKGFLLNIRNSLLVAMTVTVISLFISAFAAYSMVRFRYRFKGLFGRLKALFSNH